MKTFLGFKVRGFILVAAFFAGPGFGTSAFAQLDPTPHPYLVDLNSNTVTRLNESPFGDLFYRNINDAGQLVGTVGGAPFHAFITGPNGTGMRDLGTLGDDPAGSDSSAFDINNSGQVVGFSNSIRDRLQFESHAFITGSDGMGMKGLGTLTGNHPAAFSSASGINETGQVVGNSETAGGASHAFVTEADGMGMRDLGTLGGNSSEAHDMSDDGQVVGRSLTAENVWRAFITGPNGEGMMDLNSLVELPPGEVLLRATAINNAGQVLAIGLIPEPEIYALFLSGLGLIGFMVHKRRRR